MVHFPMSCNHLYQVPPQKTPTHQLTPRSSLPRPLAATICLPSLWIFLFHTFHTHGLTPHVDSAVRLPSLSVCSRLTHVVAWVHTSPHGAVGRGTRVTLPRHPAGARETPSVPADGAGEPTILVPCCAEQTHPGRGGGSPPCGDRVRPEPTLLLSLPGCCVYAPLGQGD